MIILIICTFIWSVSFLILYLLPPREKVNMTYTKITISFFTLFVSTILCIGQHAPVKYGKVLEKDTALKNYPGADAVILCDYGEYSFDGKTGVVYFDFTRHLRIKILNEAGLRYAKQLIPFYDLHSATFYTNNRSYILRAQTLNVDSKGKVIKTKVKSKHTAETKPDENFNASLTINFPNVKPGSIIEYEITIPTIELVNPSPWMVQYDMPSLWSELRIITPQDFNFAIKPYNMEYADVSEYKSIATSIQYPGRSFVYNANQYQFIRKNVPALPYLGNDLDFNNRRMFVKFMLDYGSRKFLFPRMDELLKATDPEFKYLNKSEKQTTLESAGFVLYKRPNLSKIAKDLNKSDRFGLPLILNMGMNDTIKKLTGTAKTDEEKVLVIYNFVRNQAEWNGRYRIFVDAGVPLFLIKLADKFTKEPVKMNTSLQKVLHKHKGTNSEINAILINLLRSAGYKANPVLVSTLNNSYLDTSFYNLHQFNHLIAAVEVDGREILLDAVKKGNGTILTSDVMNEFGILIELQKARWIQVTNPYPILPQSRETQNPLNEPPKNDSETKYY